MKETSWLRDLWFSPNWVFMKYVHLLRQIDFDEERIKREGQFQKVRETLAAANLALAVQSQTNQPVHLQLSAIDPPDFFLFQANPSDPTLPWITYVEHTTFGHHPKRTDLVAQLEATKLKFTEEYVNDYILLIEVELVTPQDVEAVRNLIDKKRITYKVWIMEGRMQDDDAQVRVVTLNSPFDEIIADLNTESQRFPDAAPAFVIQVSSKEQRVPPSGQPAPWPDPFA